MAKIKGVSIYDIRGYTEPLTMVFQLAPLFPAGKSFPPQSNHSGAYRGVDLGVIAALIVPPLIRHLPNHFIFLLSMVAFIACNIIAATASASTENGEYWKGTFWSLIIGTFGPGMYILRLSFVPWAKAKVKRCSFYCRLEF